MGPGRLAEAKAGFLRWKRDYEASRGRRPALGPVLTGRVWPGVAAAVAFLFVVVLVTGVRRAPGGPEPAAVLAAAGELESEAWRDSRPVAQALAVSIDEFTASKTAPLLRGKIEIWSDPGRGRFRSRWVDGEGSLKHALWRPREGSMYVLRPALDLGVVLMPDTPRPVVALDGLGRHGADRARLERFLMAWLETRDWRPVGLAEGFREFSSQDGVRVRAGRFGSLLVLTAGRGGPDGSITASLVLDGSTGRPRLQKLRFASAGRILELRLAIERTAPLSADNLAGADFEPVLDGPRPRPRLPRLRPPGAPAVEPPPRQPAPVELDAAELSALWVLHRAGACLGEQVEVVRESGRILVRGLVQTAERKQALSAALAELASSGQVMAAIRTFEDARQTDPAPLPNQPVWGTSAPGAQPHIQAGSAPVEEKLASHFRERLPAADGEEVRRQIVDFLNKGMALSSASLDHAWALRRLMERFPAERARELPAPSRWLLEALFREHAAAVRGSIGGIAMLTAPFLPPAAGDSAPPPSTAPASRPGPGSPRDGAVAVLDAVERLHARMTGVLAGRDLLEEPDQAWRQVGALIGEVESELAGFEERMAALTGGRSGVGSNRSPGVNP